MNFLIFGGTTEGRLLAQRLCADGNSVTVSCATEVGVEQLRGLPCACLCGRLNAKQIAALAVRYDIVVDATHPYSVEITDNIKKACEATGVLRKRILRSPGKHPDCTQVRSCSEAAELLADMTGNILLTTGSKELRDFSALPPERVFARVLPTHSAISACEEIGLPHRNIIAMQGPFSRELNEATMRQYDISILVTRNSGDAGGFEEKLSAAEDAGAELILVEPPESDGLTVDEFLMEVRELCALDS